MQTSWILIDETNGTPTTSGEVMTPAKLTAIAAACQAQLNAEFADEHGGQVTVTTGTAHTIQPGQNAYIFKATIPEAPGASAYHDINNKGVPFAFCAVTTCDSILGKGSSCAVDGSHELCEASLDAGCNRYVDDTKGTLHALEACDAVEVQSYPKTLTDGTVVYVSNFITVAWTIPGAPGPYDYMTKAGLPGAVAPKAPMQTAAGKGGNYQIECPSTTGQATQVTAAKGHGELHLVGTPRRTQNWSSRSARRGVKFNR